MFVLNPYFIKSVPYIFQLLLYSTKEKSSLGIGYAFVFQHIVWKMTFAKLFQ